MNRSSVALVGAVVAAAAMLTAAVAHGVATSSSDDAPGVDAWHGGTAAPGVVSVAEPVDPRGGLDCPGSYLSTQEVGAARPVLRP